MSSEKRKVAFRWEKEKNAKKVILDTQKADQTEQGVYDRGKPPSRIDSGYRMLEERKNINN